MPATASMKVPTKLEGNNLIGGYWIQIHPSLNKSLHLKIQNKRPHGHLEGILICLIESPYKIVGKSRQGSGCGLMLASLNESPAKRLGMKFVIKPPHSRLPPQ